MVLGEQHSSIDALAQELGFRDSADFPHDRVRTERRQNHRKVVWFIYKISQSFSTAVESNQKVGQVPK